jgi:hypothetical protein
MGIDFSHCDAHWAYSGFNRFRMRLARDIGINLDEMAGFTIKYGKSWDDIDDPIVPLLDHSDCDGHLTPEECGAIAPRLEELVSVWEDGYDKENALSLAAGMRDAARNNENLIFE